MRFSFPTGRNVTAGISRRSSDADDIVAVCDPVYPVYVDSNVMAGRTGNYDEADQCRITMEVVYMPCRSQEQRLRPGASEGTSRHLIYLCFPNNPTGEQASVFRRIFREWVDYADERSSAVILL